MSLKVSVLKHLPILLFGRDSSTYKPITPLDRDKIGESTDSGCITSIYIDSDDLSCYHSRIQREESAQLFRLRWYGSQPIPSAKSEVFVERKTHHEAWIMETSVKERFSIKAAKVLEYMSGQYDVMAAIDRRVQDGELTAEAAAPLKSLAQEIQDAIVTRNLRAKIRTRYRRTAFQLPSSNAVRVSLDTELQMCNEFQYSSWSPDQWCCNQAQMATPGAVLNFPYAVLELKLQDETPPMWVRELLETGIATPVWKFSKFLTGCTALLPPLVRMYPHWFDREGNMAEPSPPEIAAQEALQVAGFLPAPQDEQQPESAAQPSPNLLESFIGRLWPVKRGGESPPTTASDAQAVQRHRHVASASTAAGLKHVIVELPNQNGSRRDLNALVNNNTERNQYGGTAPSGTLHNKSTIAVQLGHGGNHPSPPRPANEELAIHAPLLGDNSPTASSTASAGSRRHRRGGRWRDWCCWPCDSLSNLCQPAKPPEKGRLVPVRIEPKTHFANERTFLHWLSASLILMSLSIGLLQFGGHESNVAAYIISPVALMFIAYATFVFYWRARKIERRDPYGYHDPRGPALLGGVLFSALIVNLVVSGLYSSGKLPKNAAVTSKGSPAVGTSRGSPVMSDYVCSKVVAVSPGTFEEPAPLLPQFFQPIHMASANGSLLLADQLDVNVVLANSSGISSVWSVPPHTTLTGLACEGSTNASCYMALTSARDKRAWLEVHGWTGTALQSIPSKVFSLDFPVSSVALLPPAAFRRSTLLVAKGTTNPTEIVGLKLTGASCEVMGEDCDLTTSFQASLLHDLLPADSQLSLDDNTFIEGVSADALHVYVLTSNNLIIVLEAESMRFSRTIRLPDVPACRAKAGDGTLCSWSAFLSTSEHQILAARHPAQVWTVEAEDGTRGRRTNLRTSVDV
jgi:uncharacterized membrane protein YidH (DUF202 family)